jgi:uncharacterized membrane protein YphA (DoxX/SURF4 family)
MTMSLLAPRQRSPGDGSETLDSQERKLMFNVPKWSSSMYAAPGHGHDLCRFPSRSMLAGHTTIYMRLALSAGFLGAVTDRLGMWGPYGRPNVAWGDMQNFVTYTAKLNPWFPRGMIPFVGSVITVIETALGISLLIGFRTRRAAQVSGGLVTAFGIGMTVGTGLKSALNASVFAFAGGAWLLSMARRYPLSVDALTRSA